MARDLNISHLLFVDDILIFCNGSRRDTDCLVEGLELFKRATGMLINVRKSIMVTNLVPEADLQYLTDHLPFQIEPLDGGLKYLGFHLKPNSYRMEDWRWLIGKLEKRILVWSHRWLSRAGRLVLIKSVLEAIPIYWMSLAWIPKGILEKARRLCFSYLWSGNKETRKMPWVRWGRIALPKSLGGWGLKNIFHFSKALAGKVVWRLLTTTSLWTRVLIKKYLAPHTIQDWIRMDDKKSKGGSIIWKAIIMAFEIIGRGLAWKVGDGWSLLIGRDPWPGSGQVHILSGPLVQWLEGRGLIFLSQIVDPVTTTFWNQG